jgi:hypothetical protein
MGGARSTPSYRKLRSRSVYTRLLAAAKLRARRTLCLKEGPGTGYAVLAVNAYCPST